jgi:hypothetical protein
MEDGTILKHDDRGQQVLTMLSSAAPNNSNQRQNSGEVNIAVTTSGRYAYVQGPASLVAYNLDQPAAAQWIAMLDSFQTPNFRSLLATRDWIVATAEPAVRKADVLNGNATPVYRLNFFSRAKDPNAAARETGKFEYSVDVADPTGVVQWQPVDGGIYYLTGEHKLHFLRGARKD